MSKELRILLVDDDEDTLDQIPAIVPEDIEGHRLIWDKCVNFQEALERIEATRYDIVITDVYVDRRDGEKKGIHPEDNQASEVIKSIRNRRFSPVLAISTGSKPEGLLEGPFVMFADKSAGDTDIVEKLTQLIKTNVPGIARRLQVDLDRATGSYLWEFLEKHWGDLQPTVGGDPAILERLVRRRASVQLGKLDPAQDAPTELERIDGAEFYIYPSIANKDLLRLGEILKSKNSEEYRVILTPHCFLTIQAKATVPKTDFVLTVKAVSAADLFKTLGFDGKRENWGRQLSKRIQSPTDFGTPEGRYWFLPRFLKMPDLYCDFMQVESIPIANVDTQFDRVAVLDTPFAEAMQSCFTKMYSAVGLPMLSAERYQHLYPPEEAKDAGDKRI